MASRSLCGNAAVLVTTSLMEDPTRPCVGVLPLFSNSATSCCFQAPMRVGVMFGTYPTPSGSSPPAKRVSGLMAPSKFRDE